MTTRTTPQIAADGVWKSYRRGERQDSLRDFLPAAARALLRRSRRTNGASSGEFWALRDVSFDVGPGDVLGIIGPNGAGKSTMLKLLAGIIEPTRGRVDVSGRVGALIEVAAGFHGDLTGRENVHLQGTIMGMPAGETARRFDEIVDFAGVADFIDTPVKRYSSGMAARLGFAIAAHLDPDVLIVDEVLSVGDLAFQQKAFGRLRELAARGTPTVVVSHQLERITTLCNRAILLSAGSILCTGSPAECMAAYIDGQHLDGAGGEAAGIRVDSLEGPAPAVVRSGERTHVVLHGFVDAPGDAVVGLWLRRLPEEEIIAAVHNAACDVPLPHTGAFSLEVELDSNMEPGVYRLQPFVWDRSAQRELARGPSGVLTVTKEARTFGRVYLNPRMRLLP